MQRWARERKAIVGWAVLLAGVWAVVHLPSLSIGFVSDDYCMLMGPSLLPVKGWYRYSPVGVALWRGVMACSRDPRLFRIVALALHAAVALMVFVLARRLQGSVWAGLLAVSLFVGRAEHHEVVFWSTAGFFYLPMTIAFLAGACLAASPAARPGWRYGLFYPLLVALSCFSHESGVFLLVVLVAAEWFRSSLRPARLLRRVILLLPAVAPAVLLWLIKRRASAPLTPLLSSLSFQVATVEVHHVLKALAWPWSSLSSGWMPDAAWLAVPCGLDLLLIGLLLVAVPAARKYAGLLAAVVGSLFAIRLHAVIQDRFLYLPSAVLSCLIGCGVASALHALRHAKRGTGRGPAPWVARRGAPLAAAALVAAGGWAHIRGLAAMRQAWTLAARRSEDLIAQSLSHLERFPTEVATVYFLNPPDHVRSPVSRTLSPAYVFRAGITEAMWTARQRESSAAGRPSRPIWVWPLHGYESRTEGILRQADADPAARVLFWNEDAGKVEVRPFPSAPAS